MFVAQSTSSHLDFSPTPSFPALQYLDRVDRDSAADKAGLKSGDFLLEINDHNVQCATHEHTVKLIKYSGDTLAMKVVTVKPSSRNGGEEVHIDGTSTLPAIRSKRGELYHYQTTGQPFYLNEICGCSSYRLY